MKFDLLVVLMMILLKYSIYLMIQSFIVILIFTIHIFHEQFYLILHLPFNYYFFEGFMNELLIISLSFLFISSAFK